MVKERAVNIDTMVILCSRNEAKILSTKDLSSSRIFSMGCLILSTCFWGSFLPCDSISSLDFCSVSIISSLFIAAFVLQNKWSSLTSFIFLLSFYAFNKPANPFWTEGFIDPWKFSHIKISISWCLSVSTWISSAKEEDSISGSLLVVQAYFSCRIERSL